MVKIWTTCWIASPKLRSLIVEKIRRQMEWWALSYDSPAHNNNTGGEVCEICAAEQSVVRDQCSAVSPPLTPVLTSLVTLATNIISVTCDLFISDFISLPCVIFISSFVEHWGVEHWCLIFSEQRAGVMSASAGQWSFIGWQKFNPLSHANTTLAHKQGPVVKIWTILH